MADAIGSRLTSPSRPADRTLPAVVDYSERLGQDGRWALGEASRFFSGESSVQEALARITRRLDELQIPYVVVGGLALFHHGYRRFTEDVDILVTPEGLREIHRQLSGRGYLAPFEGSRNLHDVENGVRIEFLTTGAFPGDGKPKPVAFPDPQTVAVEDDGVRYVALPVLVELKLASGMTSAGRLKDLADVQELIKALHLPESFAEQLHPYVADRFRELWQATRE